MASYYVAKSAVDSIAEDAISMFSSGNPLGCSYVFSYSAYDLCNGVTCNNSMNCASGCCWNSVCHESTKCDPEPEPTP